MVQARNFIQQKDWAQARSLLVQIDHPKAQEWLSKIDEVELGDPFEKKIATAMIDAVTSQDATELLQDVADIMVENGWSVQIDTDSMIQLEKKRLPDRVGSALVVVLLSLIGSAVVCLVIANSAKETVTLRAMGNGKVSAKTSRQIFFVENIHQANNLARSVPDGMSYVSAILLGIIMVIIGTIGWYILFPHH